MCLCVCLLDKGMGGWGWGVQQEGLGSLKAHPLEPRACYEGNTKLLEQWGEGQVTPGHQLFTALTGHSKGNLQHCTANQPGQSYLPVSLHYYHLNQQSYSDVDHFKIWNKQPFLHLNNNK